jgi:hypothetical protein
VKIWAVFIWLGVCPVTDSSENGEESQSFIKYGALLVLMRIFKYHTKDFALWNKLIAVNLHINAVMCKSNRLSDL